MDQKSRAVHIPASYTKTEPAESFSNVDIPRSHCTWHTLLSSNLTPTDSLSAGIATLPPKTGNLCPHRHRQAEMYYVISGDAEHGVRNHTSNKDFRWLYVFPTSSFEDVVYRWSDEKTEAQR
ncbi:hypothetical protein OIDMADRAFT_20016 [Oidiodendron maius Zn]|uniref:Cupin 2 conserved barrel domain-containing protein n=1 Tax=Oidiodendron maius (strain Zn) TaxID=913774 RepID=A0A0C3GTD4_OIDMZ|nr:hypothetical protein OIDMADRAFT_20016 [Oidiodendron maius Zn]